MSETDKLLELLDELAGGATGATFVQDPCRDAAAKIRADKALIADLAEALRPLAEAAINLDEVAEDKTDIWQSAAALDITAGDLRKAAAVLARVPK